MMQKKQLQPSLLVITFCILLFTTIGCDSNNVVSPEPIETEEIDDTESEKIVIEPKLEPEEITEDISEDKILEPEIKAVVNVDILHLRGGPGTDYEILDRLRLGTVLEIIGEKDEWFQVSHRMGWVHGDYVIKPESPEKLYEVLQVEIQPIGYDKDKVAIFIEESTSFSIDDFVLPEFSHPNEISNEDLIKTVTLNGLSPSYRDFCRGFIMTGKDIQETAWSIFGSDIEDIEHRNVFPYYWNSKDQMYQVEGFGPGSFTETKIINIKETDKDIIVDTVHLIYYYTSVDNEYVSHVVGELSRVSEFDSYEDFLENSNAIVLVDEQHDDGTIDNYLNSFPVRRYILSKEGNGVLYIRQSYLVDE